MLWMSSCRSRSQSEETGETGEQEVNSTFKLGRSITKIVPFHLPIKKQEQKEIITTKLVITMVIIAIVKIAVLMLWI
jgi:hypothetical protein